MSETPESPTSRTSPSTRSPWAERQLSRRWASATLLALASGDVNPAHLDAAYATDMFHRVIAHGMWGGGLISAVLGTRLPGPGTIYLSQSLRFVAPVGLATRSPPK
jgi:phosphate butyryltransferase